MASLLLYRDIIYALHLTAKIQRDQAIQRCWNNLYNLWMWKYRYVLQGRFDIINSSIQWHANQHLAYIKAIFFLHTYFYFPIIIFLLTRKEIMLVSSCEMLLPVTYDVSFLHTILSFLLLFDLAVRLYILYKCHSS